MLATVFVLPALPAAAYTATTDNNCVTTNSNTGASLLLNAVSIVAAPGGQGYWIGYNSSGGVVCAYGSVGWYGATELTPTTGGNPVVSVVATPDGHGYWELTNNGANFTFGDAQFYGDMIGKSNLLPSPTPSVVGMAPAANGSGYWFVYPNGQVFWFSSTGGFQQTPASTTLSLGGATIVSVASDPAVNSKSYYVLTSTGDVYNFSLGQSSVVPESGCPTGGCAGAPVSMTVDSTGNYYVLTSTGNVYENGTTGASGCLYVGGCSGTPVSIAAYNEANGTGYWIVTSNGSVYAFGSAPYKGGGTNAVSDVTPFSTATTLPSCSSAYTGMQIGNVSAGYYPTNAFSPSEYASVFYPAAPSQYAATTGVVTGAYIAWASGNGSTGTIAYKVPYSATTYSAFGTVSLVGAPGSSGPAGDAGSGASAEVVSPTGVTGSEPFVDVINATTNFIMSTTYCVALTVSGSGVQVDPTNSNQYTIPSGNTATITAALYASSPDANFSVLDLGKANTTISCNVPSGVGTCSAASPTYSPTSSTCGTSGTPAATVTVKGSIPTWPSIAQCSVSWTASDSVASGTSASYDYPDTFTHQGYGGGSSASVRSGPVTITWTNTPCTSSCTPPPGPSYTFTCQAPGGSAGTTCVAPIGNPIDIKGQVTF